MKIVNSQSLFLKKIKKSFWNYGSKKAIEKTSIKNLNSSIEFKNEMPMKRPREPPMLEMKLNSFILGICVIFSDEKSGTEKINCVKS